MTDPLSLGASAVAFIGIAGQVLQGCQYICNFVDDVCEGTNDLHYFKTEIKGFRAALLGFQAILQRFEHLANLEPAAEQIGLALNSASLAINKLKSLVEKCECNGKRAWWKNLKVATKKAQFVKCVDNLERAKADIALAQSSAILLLEISHSSKASNASLNVISLNSHAASISQSIVTTQDMVCELQASNLDTSTAVNTMNASLSDRIGLLNESIDTMLRTTINNVRDQFLAELNSKNMESSSPSSDISCAGTHSLGTRNTKRPVVAGPSQRIMRQVCYRRVYRTWFATITVTSISATTEQPLYSSCNNQFNTEDTCFSITIDVRPHPYVTLRGAMGFIDRKSKGTSCLNYDARLRIYNIIPPYAAIVKACQTGDIASAHRLFTSGHASPYDVALFTSPYKHYSTLLDLAFASWLRTGSKITNSNPSDNIREDIDVLKRKFDFFMFLVDSGLNPGERTPLAREVSSLLQIACASPPTISPHLGDMLRCLVTHSASDPFDFRRKYDQSLFLASLDVVPEIATCIMSQEAWPLPEPLAEHEYTFDLKRWYYPIFNENAYTLLRDPAASYIRTSLRWEAIISGTCNTTTMARVCLNVLDESRNLPGHRNGAWDMAVKARLLACLEFGMSPKDISYDGKTYRQRPAVADYYAVHGEKKLLEFALLEFGWTPESIPIMFEEAASVSLAQFIDSFRPVTATLAAGRCCERVLPFDTSRLSKAILFYLKNRDTAVNEGYRRYFPEEEEELAEVLNRFDKKYLPDLPAVNGITQDFWD